MSSLNAPKPTHWDVTDQVLWEQAQKELANFQWHTVQLSESEVLHEYRLSSEARGVYLLAMKQPYLEPSNWTSVGWPDFVMPFYIGRGRLRSRLKKHSQGSHNPLVTEIRGKYRPYPIFTATYALVESESVEKNLEGLLINAFRPYANKKLEKFRKMDGLGAPRKR